jgi:hypothetical protein
MNFATVLAVNLCYESNYWSERKMKMLVEEGESEMNQQLEVTKQHKCFVF